MNAIDSFTVLLETTDVVKQLLKSLKESPAILLGDICREYQANSQPVPEHRLHLAGYIGEAALRALVSLDLVTRRPGARLSLYSYEPTLAGLEQYEKLKADGFYK